MASTRYSGGSSYGASLYIITSGQQSGKNGYITEVIRNDNIVTSVTISGTTVTISGNQYSLHSLMKVSK